MKTLSKICEKITSILFIMGIAAISLMVLLVFTDVILRKVFSISIIGVTEMTQMLWICMILGWGGSVKGRDNLYIDILVDRLPTKKREIVEIIVTVFMIAISSLLAWRCFENAMYNKGKGVVFSLLGIQTYPFIITLSLGYVGGCIGLLNKLITHLTALMEISHRKMGLNEEKVGEAK